MNSCACLIPCYNEARRISPVLSTLLHSKTLAEIVVIDDGSTDETAELVARDFPQVTLITQAKNGGKGEAIRAGLKHIHHEYVFLCDADINGLQIEEVDIMIKHMLEHPSIDMILMNRINDVENIFKKIADKTHLPVTTISDALSASTIGRTSYLLTGERVLRTEEMRTIITQPVEGYEIEAAINQYFMDKKANVCWMPSSAVNSYRWYELGLMKFIEKYLKMYAAIIRYVGVANYRRQMDTFCLDSCVIDEPAAATA